MAKKKSHKKKKTNKPSKKKVSSHKKKQTSKKSVKKAPSKQQVEKKTKFSSELEEIISDTAKKPVKEKPKKEGPSLKTKIQDKYLEVKKVTLPYIKKIGAAALIALLLSTITVTFELISDQRVMPRIAFANMEIGYMQIDEVNQMISDEISNYQQQSFTFNLDGNTVDIPLSELYVDYYAEDTIASIPKFQFLEASIMRVATSTLKSQQVNPIYKYNQSMIAESLEEKLGLKEKRAKNARYFFNEEGVLQIADEEQGLEINSEKLAADLDSNFNNLKNDIVFIELSDESPSVTRADLEKYLDDLILKLENEITIKYQEQEWNVKLKDHLDGINFDKQNDQVLIKVSKAFLDGFLQEEVFSKIEKATSNVKIYHDENEEIIFEGIASDGISIDKNLFIKDFETAINSYTEEVTVTTNVTPAKVETDQKLKDLGVKELIGIGHTAFAGSSGNRRHNIQVAMNRFNGILIPPGETFSFNTQLGPVDGSTGYKMELVIKSTGTIPEYGGGVCQVSSTAYKAALQTGLPIVERSPHSYAVSYYAQVDGYGLDATIYPGVKDLKYTNDTPGHILMQTHVDGDNAYFIFYGTDDKREVELKNYQKYNYRSSGGTQIIPTDTLPPGVRKQVEYAHAGFDTTWDRIIRKGEEETVETIESRYRATANKVLVGEGGESAE